mmetsp:Transcript_33162/g.70110  ORF Transcript_33162/g.70110 Transcript_33162/m.70110 type:complete len:189 (+) Transcript_33162:1-567(+)
MGGMGGMGGRGRPRQPPPAPKSIAVPEKTRVQIHSLQSKPEHNNCIGIVKSYDVATGRHQVELEGSHDTVLSLKPGNMTVMNKVEITNLEAKPELNGSQGTVESYDPANGRYRVSCTIAGRAGALALQPQNMIPTVGSVLKIDGLQGAAEHNGKWAKIAAIDREAGRVTAEIVGANKSLKIKYENVRC